MTSSLAINCLLPDYYNNLTYQTCMFLHSNQDNKLGLNRRETFIMQMRKILNKVYTCLFSSSFSASRATLSFHSLAGTLAVFFTNILFFTLSLLPFPLSPSLSLSVKDRQLQVSSMSVPTPLKELGKHRVVDMSLGPTHSTVLAELGRVRTHTFLL